MTSEELYEILYENAVTVLRGWSDRDIVTCDLRRLRFAIEKMSERVGREWRDRYRIAGIKVDEPIKDHATVEDFNAEVRGTMRQMMRGFKARVQQQEEEPFH